MSSEVLLGNNEYAEKNGRFGPYHAKASMKCKGDFCSFDFLSAGLARTSLDLRNISELNGKALFGNKLSHDIAVEGSMLGLEKILVSQECETALAKLSCVRENVSCSQNNNTGTGQNEIMYDLPYYLVCFVRSENCAVTSFLRNYVRRQTENVELKLLSGSLRRTKLPGHYYRPVKVCSNCYKVYGLVQSSIDSHKEIELKNGREETALVYTKTPSDHSLYSRSLLAINCISKKDISEIRSFSNPPPAVRMVCDAVTIVLKGYILNWKSFRAMITNVEKFMSGLNEINPSALKRCQIAELSRYVRNPYFRPHDISSISQASAKLCAWVLGTFNIYRIEKGCKEYDLGDNLINFPSFLSTIGMKSVRISSTTSNENTNSLYHKCDVKNKNQAHRGEVATSRIITATKASSENNINSMKKVSASHQRRYVNKLSHDKNGSSTNNAATRTLLCSDGVTRIPYEIIGDGSADIRYMSFVVCHDLFDTINMTKLMFMDIMKKFPGSQTLLFNYPGQAWTTFPRVSLTIGREDVSSSSNEAPTTTEQVLNCDFLANCLHELLGHLNQTGEFAICLKPLHLVGIGGGLPVAISFYDLFKDSFVISQSVKSIVSINGYATMDPQLTAILHANLNAFRSFPINRPDLPISFYTNFLFSESYIKKVSRNLALNIYTAVMNPISLEGRIKLCAGALKNRDLTQAIREIVVPLISVQSLDDMVLSDEHNNVLMKGRSTKIMHLKNQNIQTFPIPLHDNTALTIRVSSGHAVWQECKGQVSLLLYNLAFPGTSYIEHIKTSLSRRLFFPNRSEDEVSVKDSSDIDKNYEKKNCEVNKDEYKLESDPVHDSSTVSIDKSGERHFIRSVKHKIDMENVLSRIEKMSFTTTVLPSFDNEYEVTGTVAKHDPLDNVVLASSPLSQMIIENVSSIQMKEHNPSNLPARDTIDNHDYFSNIKQVSKRKVVGGAQFQSLDEYLDAGIPLELIPSEILVQSPSKEQKQHHSWLVGCNRNDQHKDFPLSIGTLLEESDQELKMEIDREQSQINENKLRQEMIAQELENIKIIQAERRNTHDTENEKVLKNLAKESIQRARMRANDDLQRRIDLDLAENILLQKRFVPEYISAEEMAPPVRTMAPTLYDPKVAPKIMQQNQLNSVLDDLEKSSSMRKRLDILNSDEFESIKANLVQETLERQDCIRKMDKNERYELLNNSLISIQRVFRGGLGRQFSQVMMKERLCFLQKLKVIIQIQACFRGKKDREIVNDLRQKTIFEIACKSSISLIQCIWRGSCGRNAAMKRRHNIASTVISRNFRVHRDRKIVVEMRCQHQLSLHRNYSCSKIQSVWKMKLAINIVSTMMVEWMAAVEVQRVYRGRIDRKKASVIEMWSKANPGTERIEMGLKMIEKSKDEFERHREEIDNIHRAQEKAETKVNQIYGELKESEKELFLLEEELKEIDNIETHMAEMRCTAFDNADGLESRNTPILKEVPAANSNTTSTFDIPTELSRDHTQTRVLRHQKKARIENEFASMYVEINEKKQSLKNMEIAILDMEATRERKDREFARLQRDLMKLLNDQKHELDDLRKKGVDLESAAAISAAAASETATKAKANERQTDTMFHKHEDLLKFQFMNMSMTYFSSLNMLKEMRQINADTTASAITASAETASVAAVAAEAALLRPAKKTENESNASETNDGPTHSTSLPEDCLHWKIDDVSKWLNKLSLGIYARRFRDAAIDGEFLLELKEADLEEVLCIEHKLHRRKILMSRDKFCNRVTKPETPTTNKVHYDNPLSSDDQNIDTSHEIVFSQARHGRLKRLEESLRHGFDANAEDEYGNSLLMVAVQNRHIKIVELLLRHGALLNHTNNNGNTALHFAFAYDTSGLLPQFLLEHGANDSIENMNGLSPYDGIGADMPD